tara:strand:- start:12 stop:599 length:588 start_codon:yes stop_codon:yes gene_type:complete
MLITESRFRKLVRRVIAESSHNQLGDITEQSISDVLFNTVMKHCDGKQPSFSGVEDDAIVEEVIEKVFHSEDENTKAKMTNFAYESILDVVYKHFSGLSIDPSSLKKDCVSAAYKILSNINTSTLKNFASGDVQNKIKDMLLQSMSQDDVEMMSGKIDSLVALAVEQYENELDTGTSSDVALENAMDYLKSFYDF